MAHKKFGGWVIEDKLYFQFKISDELWYYTRNSDTNEKQVSLLFIGWYENGDKAKLFTINFLWISIQMGFAL